MKAVFETGGKQYYVAENDVIYVEKLDAEVGSEVKFDILPKRAVSEPQKDSFVRKCAYGDNPYGDCFSPYGGFVC